MYEYVICTKADEEIFEKQCIAIEKYIPGLRKADILEDVDGTKIQTYHYGENIVRVINSYYENVLYVESKEDLKKFFKVKPNLLNTKPNS